MQPKNRNTKQGQAPDALPFIVAPPNMTPGELAAISIGLRVLKGTGTPGDYFGEAIDLAKDAARFLRKLEPEQINPHDVLFFKESPNGHIEWAHIGDDVTATELTLTGLLKQVVDPDNKNKKRRTFLGSITKLKYLKEFIREAGRAQVLSSVEVAEILKSQKMEFGQFLKLLAFQHERNRAKGASKKK